MAKVIFLLILGLIFLIKGGDWFVDGASGIARRFRLPEILIGATVVSIGTTLPEVMVSAGAAMQGSGSIAYGNALGSIICNTSLIAAITIAIKPGPAARKSMTLPVAFFFGAAAIYCFSAYVLGKFTLSIGLVLLATFVIYMVSTVLRMKKSVTDVGTLSTEAELEAASGEDYTVESEEAGTKDSLLKDMVLLVVGAAVIAIGASLLNNNAQELARMCGISEKVIGLTIVALGTSLPELATSAMAALKKNTDLAIGNVIGSNIFNVFLVLGLSSIINPLTSYPNLQVDAAMAAGSSLLLLLFILISRKRNINRIEGISMLTIYGIYLAWLLTTL